MGVFSSESAAESEAEKYNDMGYNAFVQPTLIPGQGMKYKVRVGDFTSEENAAKFKSLHSK
jgi:cell division septation protein DedD